MLTVFVGSAAARAQKLLDQSGLALIVSTSTHGDCLNLQ